VVVGMLPLALVLGSNLSAGTIVAYLSLTGSVIGLAGVIYASRRKVGSSSSSSSDRPYAGVSDDRISSLERAYQGLQEKIAILQDQADSHRRKLGGLADQLSELYEELDRLRRQIILRRGRSDSHPTDSPDHSDDPDSTRRSR